MAGVVRAVRIALLASALLAPWGRSAAQLGSFGQNKIQYHDFDWHVLSGTHVDVYFYPAEERVARLALAYAEESYEHLKVRLTHEVRHRIPLIVYASHADFEQTNILPFVPPEGILGVTEYQKQRVAIPFRGSYAEFRHTLRHELVHVFQLSMLANQLSISSRGRRAAPPLWWSEGMAEYLSSDQDARDVMVVRDLATHGTVPSISQLGMYMSPIVYPLGGELHGFLARHYGEWRIKLFYQTLWKYESFERALEGTYGVTVRRLTEEWQFELRQRFFAASATRRPLELAGREIATTALKPVAVDDRHGPSIAYLSPRSGYTNIYLKPLAGGPARRIVAGERSPQFESLHESSSRMDARDGVLTFASKFGERDALFFWDLAKGKVVGRYQFDSLVSVLSPAWSPDGAQIAFSGLSHSGVSDLYVLDLASGALRRVTDDPYEDVDPTWLPDGKSLVFSSDRGHGGDEGARNLYRLFLDGRELEPLTEGRWLDDAPRWDQWLGGVVFSSDRDSTLSLYVVDTLGSTTRLTRYEGALFDPVPLPIAPASGGHHIVTGAFSDLSWKIIAVPVTPDSSPEASRPTPIADLGTGWRWAGADGGPASSERARPYQRRYSLDFATGSASTAPTWGYAQGAQLLFSDLLGDHTVAASLAFFGSTSNPLANLNGEVFYLDQSQRLNWGVGAFRLAGDFYELDYQQVYRETTTGVYGSVRYPFSRFRRIEAQTRLEYSNRDDYANLLVEGPLQRQAVLASNFLSIIGDNALLLDTGPIDGTRWNLTTGVVSDVTHGIFENVIGSLDVRRYLRTTLRSAIALRASAYVSEGTRPRAIQIGGSWLLRGYPRFSLAGTRAWVGNSEWRFPVTDFIAVGLPVGAVRLPELQGALFSDVGQAWYEGTYEHRVLGSAGLALRMPVAPGFVLRLDMGRRYAVGGTPGTTPESYYRRRFVDFFFGYNY